MCNLSLDDSVCGGLCHRTGRTSPDRTWYGEFGPNATKRSDLTVIMNWDGKNVTGIVNPGPNVVQIKVATLDSTINKWTVHFEADAKNKSGGMDHFVFDGKDGQPRCV